MKFVWHYALDLAYFPTSFNGTQKQQLHFIQAWMFEEVCTDENVQCVLHACSNGHLSHL